MSKQHLLPLKAYYGSRDKLSPGGFYIDISELPDEIIVVICSYLDHQSVLSVGVACNRLNHISHSNIIWKSLFVELVHEHDEKRMLILLDGDYRDRFMFLKTYYRLSPRYSTLNAKFFTVYKVLWIYTFAIGSLLASIMAALLMGGALRGKLSLNNTYLLWLMIVPSYLVYLLPFQLMFIVATIQELIVVNSMRLYSPLYEKEREEIANVHNTFHMLAGYFWIPTLIACTFFRLPNPATSYFSYRFAFAPVYLCTILFFISSLLYRKNIALGIVNILVCLQLFLIGAKMDCIVHDYWLVVFLPALMLPIYLILDGIIHIRANSAKKASNALASMLIILFVLLLGMRLDLILTYEYYRTV
jgi:hypothetical protein